MRNTHAEGDSVDGLRKVGLEGESEEDKERWDGSVGILEKGEGEDIIDCC